MTEATPVITPEMTMEQIEQALPSARRALFQRYHVGGCSSCAYQPTDSLTKMCAEHNILDVNEVITYLQDAQELDDRMQVDPLQVKGWLDAGEELRFLDVRQPEERELATLPGAEVLDFDDSERYMQLPKETRFVFCCRDGQQSLNIAAYFKGHGFQDVLCVRGGLDAWRAQVDGSIPEYELPTPEGLLG